MSIRTLKHRIDETDPIRLDPERMVFNFPTSVRFNLTQQRRLEAKMRAIPTTKSVYAHEDRVVVSANAPGDWNQNNLMVLVVKEAIKSFV